MKTKILIALTLVMLITVQTVVSAQKIQKKYSLIRIQEMVYQNSGIKESPLKSLSEAAKRVNSLEGKGAITVYLSRGVYGMAETANFSPAEWQFSKENRLTIRAEKLPDDAGWNPGDMPVMVSTMPFDIKETNDKNEETGAFNYGILIATSHVTIRDCAFWVNLYMKARLVIF